MRGLLLAAMVVSSGAALAQEIGTEITPVTPTSAAETPQPQTTTEQSAPTARAAPARRSASSGAFGLRAAYSASASFGPVTAATAVPSVGVSYFASDAIRMLFDLGVGFGLANGDPVLAAEAGVGFDYLLRSPAEALRPFLHAQAKFTMGGQPSFPNLGVAVEGGFGAEYFFAPEFSVSGRLMLAIPMRLSPTFDLSILTVSPGVGAAWYL